ncbi:MAG TPA: sigma-70 family RNA polymerase sigma factor [Longimicrobiales bacterium]|nr:sigma-70 family RNA polymerase sigma factor [Longimicrobiales bacterium]
MTGSAFDAQCAQLFQLHAPRLLRYFNRLTGDPELAADLTQEAFVRLFRRRTLPARPEAWLLTVAMNMLRNVHKTRTRRTRLLTLERGAAAHADAARAPDELVDDVEQARVRRALQALPERDAQLLLLRAEGYSYRDLAVALELNERSIGSLLARAKHAFRSAWEEPCT